MISRMFGQLPVLFFLLVMDGLGESAGYLLGTNQKVIQQISDRELRRERFIIEEEQKMYGRTEFLEQLSERPYEKNS